VVKALELDKLPAGSQVELQISGKLVNGATFSATDCVTIQGGSGNGSGTTARNRNN